MRIIPLTSLQQLSFSLYAVPQGSTVRVLFDAVWARQFRSIRVREELLEDLASLGVQTLFLVSSQGSDDVERYVLDTLCASSLPVLATYIAHSGSSPDSALRLLQR